MADSQAQQLYYYDSNAYPLIIREKGWTVKKHISKGLIAVDFNEIEPYQITKKSAWLDLCKELSGMMICNARFLDDLLAKPELIPESWKGKRTFFFGTIYMSRNGILCVRYLYWKRGKWNWGYSCLDNNFCCGSQVALAA